MAFVAAALGFATPALADFSACASVKEKSSPSEKIELYTICLTQGGLQPEDRAGAFNNRGVAYEEAGDLDKAFDDFSASIQNDPAWAVAYWNRGQVQASRGKLVEAEADFTQAARFRPSRIRAEVYFDRARVRWSQANYRGAIEDFDAAIKLDSKLAEAYQLEAWLLATGPEAPLRDGSKAVQLGTRAVALQDLAFSHDALAAAYAETGRFDEAQREQARAIELARTGRAGAPGQEARLKLYQQAQPFHARSSSPDALSGQP